MSTKEVIPFQVLAEYVMLVAAKKVDRNHVGDMGGARPLYGIAGLLIVGLMLPWRYFAKAPGAP